MATALVECPACGNEGPAYVDSGSPRRTCNPSCRARWSHYSKRHLPPVPGAILHEPTARWVDPENGVVFARRGGIAVSSVKKDGYSATYDGPRAHVIVWEAMNGPVPPGMVINHLDFDRANNRISNLEATTQGGNVRHSAAAGRYNVPRPNHTGSLHHSAKLDENDVRVIKTRLRAGESTSVIACDYPVSEWAIINIQIGKSWRSVQ